MSALHPSKPEPYDTVLKQLSTAPKKWLVTGCAGFIGSHLTQTLLQHDQTVVGLDNLSTGNKGNLNEIKSLVTESQWERFNFVEGDICDYGTCSNVTSGIDYVLHQAALGSVPRSLADPVATNAANVSGFLNILQASKQAEVGSFTYAASSSTYGDHPDLPKLEDRIGAPLSPYAVSKYVNELYADVFLRCFGFRATGLRYFNVFGPRQDPNGPYAAVIPIWTAAMLRGKEVVINGDGSTSRDFCYIDNVVQANLLAATALPKARGTVYNIAVGSSTTLIRLQEMIREILLQCGRDYRIPPVFKDFRKGDVRHSLADIKKATKYLGYKPTHELIEGLKNAVPSYIVKFRN